MGTNTITVTDADFEANVLQNDKPVLVDFWAPWCGPCRQIAPALEELAAEYDGKVVIAKVDVDENPNAPTTYGVRGIPNLLLFKNGEVVNNIVGAVPKSKLESAIQEVI